MVPRRRDARTMQMLRRGREPVLVLRRVLVSGPIAALEARFEFLGAARQALAVDARRVRKDVRGPLTPMRCVTWNHNQAFTL